MRRLTQTLLALVCLLFLATASYAQVWAGRGRLQGAVTDKDGKPIAGAKITLHWGKDPTQGPPPITTDAKGRWSILGLQGGAWTVVIEAQGYVPAEGPGQANEFGPAPAINVKLNPVTAQMQETAGTGQKKSATVTALENGNTLAQQQKWTEARAEYEKALPEIKDVETQVSVYRAIADTYLQERKARPAIDTLKKALEVSPGNASVIKKLAFSYSANNQRDQAIETLKTYVQAVPDDTQALQDLVNQLVDAGKEEDAKAYMARLPQGAKVDPAALLNIGIRQYNDNKLAEALQSFNRVVDENPDLPDAYYYRGLANLGLSKMKEAKADFEKLLQMQPNGEHAADAKAFLKELK